MGQANSLPKQLEGFTKQHMRFLLQVKQNPALLSTSDRTKLAFQRYLKFMEKKALHGNSVYKDAMLDEIWMWHMHRIHPLNYIQDCTAAYGYVIPLKSPDTPPPLPSPLPAFQPSVDLVCCVDRHREFIAKAEPLFSSSDAHIHYLANQYLKFLKLVPLKEPGRVLIPTIGIDLMWHTHMMIPESYAKDTQQLAGKVLDHDIYHNNNLDVLSNLAYTDELWQKQYKEPYLDDKAGGTPALTDSRSKVAANQTPANSNAPSTQTAATETVLAHSITSATSTQTTEPTTNTPTSTNSPAYISTTYNNTYDPATQTSNSEELSGVKNEVTWDQDSGSLWMGGGWDTNTTGGGGDSSGGSHSGGTSTPGE